MSTLSANNPDLLNSAPPGQDDEAVFLGMRLSTWIRTVVLVALFALLFWPNLRRLWDKTNPFDGDDNWKHAPFVPLIGLYYLYLNRQTLRAAPVKTAWTGLVIALLGILFYAWAIWPGQNDWFKDLGMIATLFGVVALLCGWKVMETAWFPILFLICAMPWPGAFYSELAGPLQKLAARVAVHALNFFGVTAWQGATPLDQPHGTKIYIMNKEPAIRVLNIAEACSGLRALMTFVTVAGAVAFLSFRPLWQRIIMVFSALPIAIFCNTLRITVQGIFDRYVSTHWSESFAHSFLGLLMMIPAFFMILLVGWILQNIMIDEVDDKGALRGSGKSKGRRRRTNSLQRVAAVPRPSQAAFGPRSAARGSNASASSADASPLQSAAEGPIGTPKVTGGPISGSSAPPRTASAPAPSPRANQNRNQEGRP